MVFKKKKLWDVLKEEGEMYKSIIKDKYEETKGKVGEKLEGTGDIIEEKLGQADNYFSKKKEDIKGTVEEKLGQADSYMKTKSEEANSKTQDAINYVNGTKEEMVDSYNSMDSDKKKNLKKAAVAAGIAVVASNPLLWVPATVYAYQKGKKVFVKDDKQAPKKPEE